jgi:hypothetical protein
MQFRHTSHALLFLMLLTAVLQHGFAQSAEDSLAMTSRVVLPDAGGDSLDTDDASFMISEDQLSNPLPFEGYDPNHTNVRWGRAAIVGGTLGALVTGIHIYQRNAWWSDQRTSFHFQDDPIYALNVDKAGHFLGGAFGSFLGRKSLEWSGFSRDASVWGGFAMGALFELYVEFEDGFAKDWGFSPGDAYADVVGAFWPVLQEYVPGVEHIQPKFSYWPSKEMRSGAHKGNAIDDYEGQTYWMSVHVEGLLPQSWKPYWPDWLALAVGVSVRNMELHENKERNIILALDYDMTKIIPGDSWLMQTLKQALNYVRFPAPAIRISPNYVAYGFYF